MATRAANGYILNVPTARREVLLDALVSDPGVSEPVPDFTHSKSHPLICFVSFEDAAITHVAKGRAGLRAGSRLRRLHLEDLTPLSTAIRHDAVLEKIPQRFEVHVARRLEEGGLLPPRSFDAFIESVRALLPESNALLDRFSKRRTARRVVQVPARDLVDPRDEDTGIAPAHTVALLAVAHAGAKRAAVEHAGARAVLPTAPREKAGPASPAPCARRPRASGSLSPSP